MRVTLILLFLFAGGPVSAAVGTAPCTHNTPVGVYCYCNSGVRVGHPKPGWQEEDMNRHHYVRPGWHVRNIKGMHGGGKLCIRDRAPTPEERAQYHSGQR